nr:(2,3-dihydroxybenzoyl)adenylate synthase [Pseudomonas vranovensis]
MSLNTSMPLPDAIGDAPDWPPAFARRYRQAGYWQAQTFAQALDAAAARNPAAIAISDGVLHLSYASLAERCQRLAGGLRALGLNAGDNVVVHLPNGSAFVEVCFALFRLGARPILALPAHRQHEIGGFCSFAQATAYIGCDQLEGFDCRQMARQLRTANPHLRHVLIDGDAEEFIALSTLYGGEAMEQDAGDPEAVACFQLSGGTTGTPKLIPRRHAEYLYNVRASSAVCGLDAQTVYLAALPMAHNFTLCCPGVIGTLLAGGRVVCSRRPDPDTCFALISAERVTVTALVPPLAMLWLDAQAQRQADLSSLRLLQVGGAKLLSTAAARVKPVLGCTLQQVLGMAEGLLCYTRLDDREELLLHTQGRPLCADDELRIVDEQGQPVPDGEVGELQVRGPYTIRGYYRLPEHNAKAFTADGFYCSGDRVRRTAEGYLVVEGRDKDQINRGGEKVAAEEVENLLINHPQVHDAALVAMPDAVLGESTCAFIVARDPAPSAFGLKQHLRSQGLAAFKVPDRIEFVAQFPQTGVGKVSRKDLRATLRQAWLDANCGSVAS